MSSAPSIQPARPATLRLAFAPDAPSARAVSEAIRSFLAEQGVPEKELFSYELCVAEASNNAIKYAVGSPPAAREAAAQSFRAWHGATQIVNLLMIGCLGVYFWHLTNPPEQTRFVTTSKFRS